ncbi:MAG: hypothetical protein IT209_10685 [Armatimonadetes bacterium]|nr:hypothetical protein [Armatimonadota bacterium]
MNAFSCAVKTCTKFRAAWRDEPVSGEAVSGAKEGCPDVTLGLWLLSADGGLSGEAA